MKYTALTPIKHDGKDFAQGDVLSLDGKDADGLLACGAVEPADKAAAKAAAKAEADKAAAQQAADEQAQAEAAEAAAAAEAEAAAQAEAKK